MIRDGFLKIAKSSNAGDILYLGTTLLPHLLPDPGHPNVIELAGQRVTDKGDGYPVKARFEVETTMTSADTTLIFAFAIVTAASSDFASLPLVVAQTAPLSILLLGSIAAGTSFDLVVPPLPTYGSAGRAYMSLAVIVAQTAITVGNALFTAGTLSAHFALNTQSEVPLKSYSSGWSV